LEHGAAVAGVYAQAHLGLVRAGPVGAAHVAEGQVPAAVVHVAVGRVDVKQVGVHRGVPVEPAFGEAVLAVVAVGLGIVIAALVARVGVDVRRGAARHVAVHVPHDVPGLGVGGLEGRPQGRVGYGVLVVEDVVQGGAQRLAAEALGAVVVAGGRLGGGGGKGQGEQCRQGESGRLVQESVFHQAQRSCIPAEHGPGGAGGAARGPAGRGGRSILLSL